MDSFFSENLSWEHQIRRLVAEVPDGGGEFYEILATAKKLRGSNAEDWYKAWFELGENSEKQAGHSASKGDVLWSNELFLRACNYFRMADFYLDQEDPRELATYTKMVRCFQQGTSTSRPKVEKVEFPYESSKLTGYLVHPDENARRPLAATIFMGGADSVKEEYYFRGARQAVELGLACLLLDGPGQGDALRLRRVFAIPDYEKPISAAIDFLEGRDDIDAERVGLVSSSLGGYFAPRAAAFEPRVKACVAWAACYDVLEDVYNFFPPIQRRIRWLIGAKDPRDAEDKLKLFNLSGVVGKIKCPLLIVHGEEDYICSIEAAYRLHREANCKKELVVFRKGEPGASHCQQDNLSAAKHLIFHWLFENLQTA